jgi:tetratricopeptide (TPR) repeat protein
MYVQEYSQLLIESGQLYLNMKKPEEAEMAFQEAIDLLEDERPQDIKSRSLWTKLSRSQSEQRKEMSNALKGAQKGRMANPLGYDERRELGSIFCDLEEFDFGMQELDYAQSWKPDKPEILVEMAQSYVKQAKKCDHKEHRKKILTAAGDKLNQALRIYDKSLITKRGVARYWLGKVHYEMGDYKKAIPHFRILYNVRSAKIHSDRDTLIIALRLAYAYLKAKSFDESDRLFDLIISEGVIFKENKQDNIFGEKYEDLIYPNEIIIRAYLGKSISCIERNGNPGIALDNARLAKQDIGSPEDCNNGTNSREHKEDYRLDCMGWICYDLGLIDEAIRRLEKSVSEQAGPSAYFHLAMAYKRKIDLWDPQPKSDPLIVGKALKCCRLAKELDLNEEYEKDLDGLIKSLTDKLSEKSPAKNNEEN